ncbi:16S rRNA (guanine(527)-N(7))-methyltransferase RsmG [Citreimonas salinaria]|uniref:Ribosomal RNA small subunit methyltransferase G n=1 Tax=Citreimonas salinaria TaxID=321339 RepID=A0A1H3FCL7_9RHOB|nr:16S rRNA (guanine(527)-N(7))-methyltransferase RsmG [Citreimonas salinaria]SDX88726.1 16S rRNA (guanine527-N7)-methyltransferase [Citreimonas salinaria]
MTERADLDVSRETNERLTLFADLLAKWNPRINLVSRSSLSHVWTRHIADSAQLFDLAPANARKWVDLGSGGGFPGLVVAILAAEKSPNMHITLVESDGRKAVFLRTVLRETGVSAAVEAARIEHVVPLCADVVSARALAPLDLLLGHVARHSAVDGIALLPKGISWQKEVDIAKKSWTFSHRVHTSETDPSSVILTVGDLSHV